MQLGFCYYVSIGFKKEEEGGKKRQAHAQGTRAPNYYAYPPGPECRDPSLQAMTSFPKGCRAVGGPFAWGPLPQAIFSNTASLSPTLTTHRLALLKTQPRSTKAGPLVSKRRPRHGQKYQTCLPLCLSRMPWVSPWNPSPRHARNCNGVSNFAFADMFTFFFLRHSRKETKLQHVRCLPFVRHQGNFFP